MIRPRRLQDAFRRMVVGHLEVLRARRVDMDLPLSPKRVNQPSTRHRIAATIVLLLVPLDKQTQPCCCHHRRLRPQRRQRRRPPRRPRLDGNHHLDLPRLKFQAKKTRKKKTFSAILRPICSRKRKMSRRKMRNHLMNIASNLLRISYSNGPNTAQDQLRYRMSKLTTTAAMDKMETKGSRFLLLKRMPLVPMMKRMNHLKTAIRTHSMKVV
mmetsp:Transcript_14560/g.35379  ORF Transcript_14560/g.35379 Transcript_14560/m.35379 type:complete len:212 (+) Transcript_14560:1666-2301(+)